MRYSVVPRFVDASSLAADEPALLEPPQQRIDRVGVNREDAAEGGDPLHQAVAAVGLGVQHLQDQGRKDGLRLDLPGEDAVAPQLGGEVGRRDAASASADASAALDRVAICYL